MRIVLALCAAFAILSASAAHAAEVKNLCPNPGIEEAGVGTQPLGWSPHGGAGTWATDEVHAGERSLKVVSRGSRTIGWTSDVIRLPQPGCQFGLSIWARLEKVTGGNGAYIGFYHTDEKGKRIGQSGFLRLGGAGDGMVTRPWRRYSTMSKTTPEVKGVRVNVRLYRAVGTAWFDDIVVSEYRQMQLLAGPRSLRRGLRWSEKGKVAIVSAAGSEAAAGRIQSALRARECKVPIVPHDKVNLPEEKRDLIILGNLATSKAVEYLYLHSYTYEDLYFPGGGGYVLRPLINPLGTGGNLMVVGASDENGLRAGVEHLLELVRTAQGVLDTPLIVKTGAGYKGLNRFPWPLSGPRREMASAAAYLKSGDLKHAHKYRAHVLKKWFVPDDKLLLHLHLYYVTKTMSWDLMES